MFIIIGFNDVALQLHRQGKCNTIEEFALQHKILEAYNGFYYYYYFYI